MGAGRGAHSRPENELMMLAWAHETTPEPNFSDEDQDRIDPPFSHKNGIDNYGYAIVEQMMEFTPRLADAGGLTATSSGFYGTTPDASPLIGIDANLDNLVHAAGFSGHGLMHAPISALLVEAIIAGMLKMDGRFGFHHHLKSILSISLHSLQLGLLHQIRKRRLCCRLSGQQKTAHVGG